MIRVDLTSLATRDSLTINDNMREIRSWCREALGKNSIARGEEKTWFVTTDWMKIERRSHCYPVIFVRDERMAMICTLRWA